MRMKEIKLFVLKKKDKLIFAPSSFDANGVDSWLRQGCSFLNSGVDFEMCVFCSPS